MALTAVIPNMTSNNKPAPFVASASSVYPPISGQDFQPWHSFSDDGEQWYGRNKVNQWLQIDLGKPRPIHGYKVSGSRFWTQTSIRSWNLKASNDGTTWTLVHTTVLGSNEETFYKNYLGTYRYWRIEYLTDNGINPWASIAAFQLYTTDDLKTHAYTTLEQRKQYMQYAMAFLTSSKNPRTDKKIIQSNLMSYLNSEDGSSFIFKYKPFTLSDSMIDKEDIKFADRLVNHTGVHLDASKKADRPFIHESYMNEHYRTGLKKVITALANPDFFARLQEGTAFVYAYDIANNIQRETILPENKEVADRYLEDKLNSIINDFGISGIRKDILSNAIFTMLDKTSDRANERVGHETILEFADRKEFHQEVAGVIEIIISYMHTLRTGISLKEFIVKRTEDHQDKTYRYDDMRMVDEALLPVHKTGEYLISTRIYHNQGIKTGLTTFGYVDFYKQSIQDPAFIFGLHKTSLNQQTHVEDGPLFATVEDLSGHVYAPHINVGRIRKNLYGDFIYTYGDMESKTMHVYDRHKGYYRHHKESIVDELIRTERQSKEANDDDNQKFITPNGFESIVSKIPLYVEKDGWDSKTDKDNTVLTNSIGYRARVDIDQSVKTNLGGHNSSITQDYIFTDHGGKDSGVYEDASVKLNLKALDAGIDKDASVKLDLKPLDARIVEEDDVRVNKLEFDSFIMNSDDKVLANLVAMDSRIENVMHGFNLIPLDARHQDDMMIKVDKLRKQSWVIHMLTKVNSVQKASMIVRHQTLFDKIAKDAYLVSEQVNQLLMDKIAKQSLEIQNDPKAIAREKEAIFIDYLLSDKNKLDTYFNDLFIGSDKKVIDSIIQEYVNGEREFANEGLLYDNPVFTNEPENFAIIEEVLLAREKDPYRDAFVPENPNYAQDESDWEDIWNKYVPGVDVLDVPNSDYNYEKLADQVYDKATGVPLNPLSPLNVPEVKVKTPLHHPMPDFIDVGTFEVVVDNYVLIDVILALESLKHRNRLKYAGMPAERAMQDMLSKLWTWIWQSIGDDPEYIRTFRMVRWYMEHVVIKLSEHVLHRTYGAFKSKYHTGEGLGIANTKPGWMYFPAAGILQTNSTVSKLTFSNENFIDSKFIIRGYLDNPSQEGTIEVKVDSVIIDTITVEGPFTKEMELPMGNHTYDVFFHGNSGVAAISYIEIGGAQFLNAWTTSDDSNTNGLKAATLLIEMMLRYFEIHHGDLKIKGTMAIKQRKLWQVT